MASGAGRSPSRSAITRFAQCPEDGLVDTHRLIRKDGSRDPIEQVASLPFGTLCRHPEFHQLL
jgi:hypothetical protein